MTNIINILLFTRYTYTLIMPDIISYKNLSTDKLEFSDLKTDGTYQDIFMINIEGERKDIQLTESIICKGGIPRIDDYHETDDKRTYFTIPLNIEKDLEKTRETKEENTKRQAEATLLKEVMKTIDTILSTDEFKEKMFGKARVKKMEYSPLVKGYRDDDDDEAPPEDELPLKIKIKYYWKREGDGIGPSFKIFKKVDSKKLVEVDTTTIPDIDTLRSEYIKYMGVTIKPVVRIQGWANKKKGTQKCLYGAKLILQQIAIKERAKSGGSTKRCMFLDEEVFDAVEPEPESVNKSVEVIEETSVEVADDDEDEDEDEDTDDHEATEETNEDAKSEDELPEIKPKRRNRKKNN